MVCHVQAWGTGVLSVHNVQIVHRKGLPRPPLVGNVVSAEANQAGRRISGHGSRYGWRATRPSHGSWINAASSAQ
jgi:hypothetical protein